MRQVLAKTARLAVSVLRRTGHVDGRLARVLQVRAQLSEQDNHLVRQRDLRVCPCAHGSHRLCAQLQRAVGRLARSNSWVSGRELQQGTQTGFGHLEGTHAGRESERTRPLAACTRLTHGVAQEEAVIQRVQLLALGQLVRGANLPAARTQRQSDTQGVSKRAAHQAQQRHRQALVAIVKQPLVQYRQQRVQHRRVGFEHLQQRRQHAILPAVAIQRGAPRR